MISILCLADNPADTSKLLSKQESQAIELKNLTGQDTSQLLNRHANPQQVVLTATAPVDETKTVIPNSITEVMMDSTACVSSNVNTGGGNFTGRDKVVQGDEVQGDKVMADKVDGGKIEGHISNVGAGAQIAIGRGIYQEISYTTRQLTNVDVQQVAHLLSELKSQIAALDIPEKKKVIGEEFVGQLEQELTKQTRSADGSVIKVAGDWLLKNTPSLAGTLANLFMNPIVSKVIEATGEVAVDWVKKQFGER